MAKAIKVTPEGEVAILDMPEGDTLQWLYKQIGCTMVDLVRLDEVHDMWMDDDFVTPPPVNGAATLLRALFRGEPLNLDYPVYGSVILARHDGRGATTGLTDNDVRSFNIILNGYLAKN